MFSRTTLLAALGAMTVASASSAATVLLDEDFQSPLQGNDTDVNGTMVGWTSPGNNPAATRLQTDNLAPYDANHAVNQAVNMEYNGNTGYLEYDLGHNWAAGEVFEISLNANSIAWNIQDQRWITPKLIETGSGDVLWEAPADANSELYHWTSLAVDGFNQPGWNSAGIYNNGTWQDADQDDVFFSFTVNADDFTNGTEGSNIKLQINSTGTRGVTVDNIKVELVPEPSSLALLGLGGLMMVKRRRRNHHYQRC